jgi:AraC family transcriptional regulator
MEGVSKLLTCELEQCAITIYQVAAHSADDLHDHSGYYQISIPLNGSTRMECNGEVRVLNGRQRLVLSPGYRHRHYAGEEPARMLLLFFREDFLREVQADRLGKPVSSIEFVPWAQGATDGFRHLAERVVLQTMSQPLKQLDIQETELELARLLLCLQDGTHVSAVHEQSALVRHPALRRAMDYLQEHASEDIHLEILAKTAELSKYHFIRLFREQVGQTPAQYLTDVRVNKAIQLLQKTDLDITQIAYETGFGSLGTFERAFKKRLGLSPSQYRSHR